MKQSIVSRVEKSTKTNKDRRSGNGLVIALSRRIYNLHSNQQNATYYVESESSDNNYYFLRYNPSVFEWCSCKDYENSKVTKCKHLYAVEYGIRYGTIIEVDKLPKEVKIKRENNSIAEQYKNYSIAALNILEQAEIEAENSIPETWECDIYEW